MRNVSAFHFETTTCPTCSLRETSSPRSRFWNFLKKLEHRRMPKKPSVYIFLYFPYMFPKEPDWDFQLKLRPQNPLYLRKPLGEPAGVESEVFFSWMSPTLTQMYVACRWISLSSKTKTPGIGRWKGQQQNTTTTSDDTI